MTDLSCKISIGTDTSQSVRRHIEGDARQDRGGDNRRGGPPPGGNGGGGGGGPPPGGNAGPPRGGNGRGGGPRGGNGGNGGPPPGGNDGGGRRGRPPTRGARNTTVPRRSNAAARSDRTAPDAGPRRDPDSDDGASHPCGELIFSIVNLMLSMLPLELWGAVSPPPPDVVPQPGPTHPQPPPPAPLPRAPQTVQRPVPGAGPNTSTPQTICFCGKPTVEFTVRKESENKGRQFRRCGQPEDCDFFEWVDEILQNDKAKRSRTPNVPSIPAKRPRRDDAVRVSDDQPHSYRRTLEKYF